MTWKCLVRSLNGKCSGMCEGTSYRQRSNPSLAWKLSLKEMDILKINDDDDDDDDRGKLDT